VENVTAEALPESFRVKLADPTQYDVVASAFAGRPGIEQVNDQRQILDKFFALLNGLQAVALIIAIVMLVVTVLLIVNTMRVAAFSRRRETGIMRLVGASNFYIQLPFLLEAAVAAALGAGLAVVGSRRGWPGGGQELRHRPCLGSILPVHRLCGLGCRRGHRPDPAGDGYRPGLRGGFLHAAQVPPRVTTEVSGVSGVILKGCFPAV
jgi:hypothetical protein